MELPTEEISKSAQRKADKKKQKEDLLTTGYKSKAGTKFASYEEFASILEEGLDETSAADKAKRKPAKIQGFGQVGGRHTKRPRRGRWAIWNLKRFQR